MSTVNDPAKRRSSEERHAARRHFSGMPVLPLRADCLSRPTQVDVAAVGGVMLWPDDSERIERWRNAAYVAAMEPRLRWMDKADLVSLCELAAKTTPFAEQWEEALGLPLQRGSAVGLVFADMVIAHVSGERPTLAVVMERYASAPRRRFPWLVSVSRMNNEVWRRYKPVAPLWAAWVETGQRAQPPAFFPCSPDALGDFLGRAEAFRVQGEGLRIKHSGPLLQPGVAHHPPVGLGLPVYEIRRRPR
jgi:hypothetical protein